MMAMGATEEDVVAAYANAHASECEAAPASEALPNRVRRKVSWSGNADPQPTPPPPHPREPADTLDESPQIAEDERGLAQDCEAARADGAQKAADKEAAAWERAWWAERPEAFPRSDARWAGDSSIAKGPATKTAPVSTRSSSASNSECQSASNSVSGSEEDGSEEIQGWDDSDQPPNVRFVCRAPGCAEGFPSWPACLKHLRAEGHLAEELEGGMRVVMEMCLRAM
jgi:hypothetical protein